MCVYFCTPLLLLTVIMVLSLQRRILFPRQFTVQRPEAASAHPGSEKMWVESPEGPVEGWFLPGDGVSTDEPGPAVIFAHGNAELIDDWPEMMQGYTRLGVSVLLAEYRGYGRSAGAPSQTAITADFEMFLSWLHQRDIVDSARVVYHGRSLGGGAVCALAKQQAPAAMVLQSTFTGVRAVARRFLIPGFLILDAFENLPVVTSLDVPVLIVHGQRDDLIPYSHAVALDRAADNSELVTYEASHNDCPPSWLDFWNRVEGFLRKSQILPNTELPK